MAWTTVSTKSMTAATPDNTEVYSSNRCLHLIPTSVLVCFQILAEVVTETERLHNGIMEIAHVLVTFSLVTDTSALFNADVYEHVMGYCRCVNTHPHWLHHVPAKSVQMGDTSMIWDLRLNGTVGYSLS
ncbi:hypothetical protein Ddye_018235 [Dipteronia dyeriana]|uniref:Uncharacterized protein n=1 Tax=Dipteronia dyeriana TaxID=168575 RepID=A0AAD9X195_9ROSI|nr:hypothetical protein Ddye_018235 [Dipteronia dyeriana]